MKTWGNVLILSLLTLIASAKPVPDEVMQKFKENVESEMAAEKEDEESNAQYMESHRYDVPSQKEHQQMKDKEKSHGRDDLN